MTARVVLQSASRSRWLCARRKGLGGTDVAAVLGFSPYATPLQVWLSKTGRAAPADDNYPMARGRALEGVLLGEYARQTGAIVERPPTLLAHPDRRWMLASLDALAHHPDRTVILDAKSAGWRGREPWWDEERLCPDVYAVQMLHYLAVTGLDEAVLVADVAGEYTTVTVARDREWEAVAIPLLQRWWTEHVVADTPPAADWGRDSVPDLNRAWLTAPGTAVEASQSIAGAVEAYQALQPAQKEREATLKRLRAQIREGMGTAQVLTVGGEKAASLDARGVLRVTQPPREQETTAA